MGLGEKPTCLKDTEWIRSIWNCAANVGCLIASEVLESRLAKVRRGTRPPLETEVSLRSAGTSTARMKPLVPTCIGVKLLSSVGR